MNNIFAQKVKKISIVYVKEWENGLLMDNMKEVKPL